MSLKTTVKRALHSAGVASTLPRRDGASFILAAHVVQEAEAEPLADVIRLLRRSFSLVSLDEMLSALRVGRCRNLVTLTFDDGLRNQMTVAYDVLSGLRAPATFYVCPALVGAPAAGDLCLRICGFVRTVLADLERDAAGPARSDLGGDRERHAALLLHRRGGAALRPDGLG